MARPLGYNDAVNGTPTALLSNPNVRFATMEAQHTSPPLGE